MVEVKERFHDDLLQKRTVYLSGEINASEASRVGKAIILLNAKSESDPITLFINSQGGDVDAGLDIYDIIKYSKAPVAGIVYRVAASMAAVVLQACTTRKMFKHAEIGLHPISVKKSIIELQDNLEKALEYAVRQQGYICDIFANATGYPLEKIQAMLKEKPTIFAQEAKKLNLIDEVI